MTETLFIAMLVVVAATILCGAVWREDD